MSKVIGLSIKLEGGAADLDKLKELTDALEAVAKRTADVKRLTDEIKRLEDELESLKSKNPNKSLPGGTETEKNIKTLAELRAEMRRLAAEGKSYEDLARQAGELREQAEQVNAAIRRQQQEFRATSAATGSYKQLSAQLVVLRDQFRNLSEEERKGQIGRDMLKTIQQLDKELKSLDANMGQYQRNVGNYESAFRGLKGLAVEFGAAFGISAGLQEVVTQNKAIASSISDVQKTTGLSKEEVRQLRDELAKVDTRTTLEGLLAISEGAGRLGLGSLGVEGLAEFAEAVDKVNVALGDVLEGDPDQIATDLAKLSSSFGLDQTFGVAGGIERIGAAINLLGSSTKANENFILGATKRLQGLATTAGFTIQDILGLTATLDELALTEELSTSAVQRFVVGIAQAPEEFARLAQSVGVSKEQFIELTKNNPNEALVTVLKAAQTTSGGLEGLNEVLTKLGITSIGEIQTITALAKNIEVLGKNQSFANVELAKTEERFKAQNSLLNEFNTKNQDLAASIEKAKNALIEFVTRSGVTDFIQAVIQGFTKLVLVLAAIPKFLYDNRAAIIGLTAALVALNSAQIAATLSTLRKAAADRIAAIELKKLRISQFLLNSVMNANPISKIIAVASILIGVITTLYQRSETFRNGVNNLWKEMQELYEKNVLVKSILFLIIEPIKAIIGLVKDWDGAVAEFKAQWADMVTLVKESSYRMQLQFQKVGASINNAFSLGGNKERLAEIENEINKSLERTQAVATGAQKRKLAAEAKADADARQKKMDADEAALEAIEKRKTEAATAGERERANVEEQARQEQTRKNKEAAEQRAKDRIEAAKRIVDLENELIKNQFDRQAAQATTGAQREIAGLVGDPAQIERQTELIRQKLREQLDAINEERAKAQNQALELVRKYNEDLVRLQAGTGVGDVQGQLQGLAGAFGIDTKKLELNFAAAQKIALEQYSAGLINETQYQAELNRVRQEYESQKTTLLVQNGAAELLLRQQLAEQREIQLRAELDAELAAIEQARQERMAALQAEVDAGNVSGIAAAAGGATSEELARQQKLEAEREFGLQIAQIRQETALQALEYQEQVTARELELAQKRQAQLIELDQRRRDIIIGYAGEMSDAFAELLSGQVEDTRDFYKKILTTTLDAIERIMLLYVAQATAVEVGTKGVAGIATSFIATAVIKGAIAGLKGIVSKFEEGGTVGGAGEVSFDNGRVPSQGGIAQGNRHAQNGIRGVMHGVPVEIEGGEFVMRNGRKTHVVNRRSTSRFGGLLAATQAAFPHNAYSARREAIARSVNMLEGGGTISGINTPPLTAPVSPSQVLGAASLQAGLTSAANNDVYIGLVMEMIAATNKRIDRIQVVNDPAQTIKYGNIEALKIRNEQQ